MRSVLLVHPDADRWLQSLAVDADVTTVDTAQAARAYLAGTAFDLVLVGADVDGAEAIGALRDVLGLSTAVETVADADALAERLGRAAGVAGGGPAAPSQGRSPGAAQGPAAGGAMDALGQVRDELGRVAHALNNPLAVIAGNAQLGLELAGALGADESIAEAFASIEAAAAELEALFAEVAGLRALVSRHAGG